MSASAVTPMSTSVKLWRIGLIALGVVGLIVGVITLLNDVGHGDYIGILIWLGGSLVIHDGIIGPIVFGIGLLMRRAGKKIPWAVIGIIQGALVVAAIISLVAVPQVLKQGIGSKNPTILPLDYGPNLLWFYLGLAVVTAATIVIYLGVRARRRAKP